MKARGMSAAALIAALLLAACGAGEPETEGDGSSAVGPQGDFNIAYGSQPPTLDPSATTGTVTRHIGRLMYEQLIAMDADGVVQPVLAESYELSEDGTTLTFDLREDVAFHDGTIMEAEDAVASLERWRELADLGRQYFSDAEIDTPEEGVVTVRIPEGMSVMPQLLAEPTQSPYIMPAEIAESAGAEGATENVGTGPYQYGEWQTDQHVRLEAFDEYTPPSGESDGITGERDVHFENVYFHFVSDPSTRVTGIQTGEYDMAIPVPWDNASMVEDTDGIYIEPGETTFGAVIFNKQEGPMTDVNMRRAVYAAFEPEPVLQAAFSSEEYYGTQTSLTPETSPWHTESNHEMAELALEQDLTAAAEYLQAADYDGETITFMTTRDNEEHYNQAVVIQQQLIEAGIDVELEVLDWPTVLENQSNPEVWDITITGFSWRELPVTTAFLQPSFAGWTEDEGIAGSINDFLYAGSEDESVQAAQDLQDAYYEYLPVLITGQYATLAALQDEFDGFTNIPGTGEVYYHVHRTE